MVEAHFPTGNPPTSRYGPKFVKNPKFVWEIGVFRDFCHAPPVPPWTKIFTAQSGTRGANIRLKFQAPTRNWSLAFCAPIPPGKQLFLPGEFCFFNKSVRNHPFWVVSVGFCAYASRISPLKKGDSNCQPVFEKSPVAIWRFFEKSGDFLFGQVFLAKKGPAQHTKKY